MTTTYRPAAAAERIAKELIPKHHEHLVPVEIRYLFVDPVPKASGRTVWGRARTVSGLNAYLLAQPNLDPETAQERLPGGDFEIFVIEFAEMVWLDLDGMWRQDIAEFAKTVEQLTLADRWNGPKPDAFAEDSEP